MFSGLLNKIYKQLDKRRNYSDDELYRYVLMTAVAVVSMAMHILFAIFFGFFCPPLSIMHSISFFVYILILYLINKKFTDTSGVLVSFIIIFCSFATIYYIGGSNYTLIYQLLALLLMAIVPFKKRYISIIAGLFLVGMIIVSYFFENFHQPLTEIGSAGIALSVINLTVVSTGLIVLILLQRFVKKFIDNFNTKHIAELQTQAYVDSLTGLYNRRYAEMYINLFDKSYTGRAYIAVLDIDDFKLVNDTYGLDAGDVVLKVIANIMRDNLDIRDPVFRWGGEEFVAILYDDNENAARQKMENIRKLIRGTPMLYKDIRISITVTVGMSALDFGNFGLSFKTADKNMYHGKQSGKDQTVIQTPAI